MTIDLISVSLLHQVSVPPRESRIFLTGWGCGGRSVARFPNNSWKLSLRGLRQKNYLFLHVSRYFFGHVRIILTFIIGPHVVFAVCTVMLFD